MSRQKNTRPNEQQAKLIDLLNRRLAFMGQLYIGLYTCASRPVPGAEQRPL